MTNEEYIKSLDGVKMISYLRKILTVDLADYVDWDKWLNSPRCSFIYKGIIGKYTDENGKQQNCTIVERCEIFGVKYCKIILIDESGKHYIKEVDQDKIVSSQLEEMYLNQEEC